ncbi:MAG: amidase [Gemmatimonadaceae bacterium]|jgi:amidase|nr:amidase [Gemmatimonadaceae bacterium]
MFLGSAAVGAASGLVGSLTGPSTLAAAVAPSPIGGDPIPGQPTLLEVTFSELAEGMETGRWNARTLVEEYLDAIDRFDRRGPALNAILEVNPDALDIADALDVERQTKGARGPLHGIPILLKDNIGTADRLHTSAGSLALAESFAPRDAHVVERLRAAGAIVLGKANMSEWSNARGRGSIGGWSGRGRLTRNPYALDRSAGGSSSGTAAAVAANLAAGAVGTETLGSIMTPAALCGLVGVKPTVGLVGRSGIIPVSYTQDTPGPMCRTVRDAAMLLSVMAGPDPRDKATTEGSIRRVADYTTFLDPNGLRGARIGIARNLFGSSLLADRVIERALDEMRDAGAILIDNANVDNAEVLWSVDAEVLSFELKASLNEYLASLGGSSPVKSLRDLIAFNERNSDRELLWFGQETFQYAESKGDLSSPAYIEALGTVRQLARKNGIDAALARHQVDAIVAPTTSPAWLIDLLLGDNAAIGPSLVSAAAGYPSITVPAGDVQGLPVGMIFIGTAWSEPTLFKYAYGFEQTVRARRAPTFLPSVPLRP